MAVITEKSSERDFRILGVHLDASPAAIKRAYRELIKTWHPDQFQQRPASERFRAEEKLKEITGAYRRIAAGLKNGDGAGIPASGAWSAWPRPETPGRNSRRRSWSASRSERIWPEGRPHSPRGPGLGLRFARRFREAYRNPRSAAIFLALFALIFFFSSNSPVRILDWMTGTGPARTERVHAPEVGTYEEKAESGERLGMMLPENLMPEERVRPFGPPGTIPAPEPEAPAAPAPDHFTLGSSRNEVARVQGAPSEIRGNVWVYGLSDVGFNEGRVYRYNNFDGVLKVVIAPPAGQKNTRDFFTMGSDVNEVLAVQGTPTRLEGNRWFYGFSEVRFKERQVEGYENFFGDLKVRILPSDAHSFASSSHFTIGSIYDEVLAVQGTPSSIRGNLWYYDMSSILFRNGKVQYVANSGGNLRFAPPREKSGK